MEKETRGKKFLKSKMFTLLLLEAALIVLFSVWARAVGNNFFAFNTFVTLLDSLVVTSFLAIGAGCLLVSGEIDLSQAAVGAFGGVLVAMAVKYWMLPWPLAVVITLVLCGAFGAVNAVLVTKFSFQSFIATLAMASVIQGIMMFVSVPPNSTSPQSVVFQNAGLKFIGSYKILGLFPFAIFLMLAAFIVYGLVMNRSKFGLRVYLIGGNPTASWLAGIDPKRMLLFLFVNSAILGGVAGVLAAARAMQGGLSALGTAQFTGLTAAVLGGISFGGGTGGLGGAFVGLVIINTFQAGMAIVNVSPFWTNAFSGLILLIALVMDYFSKRSSGVSLH
ncbi:MAG: ABC transporter permease [Clostridiales Family XIII bacterium]|jgi:ribose/xylose/arabinose/galactoside ABC-type transport system permease subunit|nr:ABC transporter permease [Clostridiales Family XIII bacterium]